MDIESIAEPNGRNDAKGEEENLYSRLQELNRYL